MDDSPGRVRDDANDVNRRATEYTGGDVAGDSADADERTRQIRDEIAETRVELTETIDAIQEKLTPRNIVASATDRVRNAATERVREMADTARQTTQQAVDYTRDIADTMGDRVRQNSIPLALIGVGAAWLLTGTRRSSFGRGVYRGERDYGHEYGGEWTRDEVLYEDAGENGLMARIRNNPIPATLAGVGLTWLAFSSSEPGNGKYASRWNSTDETSESGIAQNVTESASQMASRTREYVSGASDSMRRMARRRQYQLQHMVQDNPLLVGCGALLLGVAFGLAVPETETENEWLGAARDNMVGRARDMARDAASQVQDAAGTLADTAGKIADKTQP